MGLVLTSGSPLSAVMTSMLSSGTRCKGTSLPLRNTTRFPGASQTPIGALSDEQSSSSDRLKSYVVDAFQMSKCSRTGFAAGAGSSGDAGGGSMLAAEAAAGTGAGPISTRARGG